MHHILIIALSDIERDPRVSRQIKTLIPHYTLSVAGRSGSNIEGITFVPLIPRKRTLVSKIQGSLLLKTYHFSRYYWGLPDIRDALVKLNGKRFDLVIANDVETLPLALRIANGAKVLLDAHEYAPLECEDKWIWRYFSKDYATSFLCREHLSSVDAMMTVSNGIAEEYARNFNIPKPFLVLNAPYYKALEPTPCGDVIRLIHHGIADPSRKIERMIEMMDYVDNRFLLSFMLIEKDKKYLTYLRKKAAPNPRIRFIPPVNMLAILDTLSLYDIGLYLLPPLNMNAAKALPNKFFEFIQARLAVAIGPSQEMARYVRKYDCGIIASDFSPFQLATEVNQLKKEQVEQYKRHSHKAAQELCFEASQHTLLENVQNLLAG